MVSRMNLGILEADLFTNLEYHEEAGHGSAAFVVTLEVQPFRKIAGIIESAP